MPGVIFAVFAGRFHDNPPTWDARCGYDDGLEQRLGDMLVDRDVHAAERD